MIRTIKLLEQWGVLWSLKYFSGYNIVLLKKTYKIQKRWTELIFDIASNLVACSYSNIVLHNLDNICSFISSNKILIIIPHHKNLFASLIFNTRLWTCSQLFSISPMLGVCYYCFAITNSMMNIFFLFLLSLYYKFTGWVPEVIDINLRLDTYSHADTQGDPLLYFCFHVPFLPSCCFHVIRESESHIL